LNVLSTGISALGNSVIAIFLPPGNADELTHLQGDVVPGNGIRLEIVTKFEAMTPLLQMGIQTALLQVANLWFPAFDKIARGAVHDRSWLATNSWKGVGVLRVYDDRSFNSVSN